MIKYLNAQVEFFPQSGIHEKKFSYFSYQMENIFYASISRYIQKSNGHYRINASMKRKHQYNTSNAQLLSRHMVYKLVIITLMLFLSENRTKPYGQQLTANWIHKTLRASQEPSTKSNNLHAEFYIIYTSERWAILCNHFYAENNCGSGADLSVANVWCWEKLSVENLI